MYPDSLNKLIDCFKKMPSVGEKSAERMALSLLKYSDVELKEFSKVVQNIKQVLKPCKICGMLTEEETCHICNDESRSKNIICVLEDYKSVFAFEKIGNYKGQYHVLNGLISPIDNINPEDINLPSLIKRVENIENCEIIIALKSTLEGEMTTLYIDKVLNKKNIKVSRLSYGISMGAEIDYLDSITLERALADRKDVS